MGNERPHSLGLQVNSGCSRFTTRSQPKIRAISEPPQQEEPHSRALHPQGRQALRLQASGFSLEVDTLEELTQPTTSTIQPATFLSLGRTTTGSSSLRKSTQRTSRSFRTSSESNPHSQSRSSPKKPRKRKESDRCYSSMTIRKTP